MPNIRSITRALDVLRTMNLTDGSRLQDLQQICGLPSPTLYRILQTLRDAGYVQSEGGGRYHLTEKVRELGCGYTQRLQIADVAAPIALRVTRQIRWPLGIGTLDGDSICVRYSTMPHSPLAVQATTLGHRLGLLDSAMGLAYLAFCGDSEKAILIDLLQDTKQLNTGLLERLLSQIRSRGYGVRLPRSRGSSATLAVPIRVADQVSAILSMTTFGRSMTQATISKYAPILRETAIEIGDAFVATNNLAL